MRCLNTRMAIAADHLGHPALIDSAQGGGLVLIQAAHLHEEAYVSRKFG